ncbi:MULTISPECIES: glycosyltransferase family 25 protein [unclassified Nitratireductor]|uniref:glycosyltransferase family 25 protein n=1 Tax=unclassified Nitratireductor TaxID=2641084 RepID=UPI0025EC77FA|nr:glycosyltransferase family 25 protein [Nitratireductor sp.]
MKIEGFIVHLERATARRPQVEHLMASLPVESHVVDAVDGQELGDEEIGRHYVKGLHHPDYPFVLKQSEIACFLSHRKVWRMIVERGLDAGLIVEDDVALQMPFFGRCLELARRGCTGKAYVQFRISPVRGKVQEVAREGEIRLVAPEVSQLGTVAQLVTREAAEHLLALSDHFDRPVDTFLQLRWVTGIAPLCVVPSGISDQSAEIGGSTVSASGKVKRSISERIRREWKRFAYRSKVRKYSRGWQATGVKRQ